MFRCRIVFGFLITLAIAILVHAEDKALDAELKNYQKLLEKTEKLAKDKSIKARVKTLAKSMERSRKVVKTANLPAIQGDLLAIQKELRSFGNVESAEFQKNIRSSIHLMIPLLLKAGAYHSETVRAGNLMTAIFHTPEGSLYVTLPADAVAGETISGTGKHEPQEVGSQYKLFLKDSLVSSDAVQKWSVPADLTSMPVILRDDAGTEVLSLQLPLSAKKIEEHAKPAPLDLPEGVTEDPFPGDIVADIEITNLMFRLSTTSVTGGTLEITGPFDGDFATTTVSIAREPLQVIAESARKVIVRTPVDRAGKLEVTIRENDIKTTCVVRNVKALFWPAKNVLQPGEALEVAGRIEGLNWLKKPLVLSLINDKPSVVTIEAPELIVNPSDVSEAGTIEFKRMVTGLKGEPFVLSITIDHASVEGACESPN